MTTDQIDPRLPQPTTPVISVAPANPGPAFVVVHNAHESAVYAREAGQETWRLVTSERGDGAATTAALRATGVEVVEHTDLPHLLTTGTWQETVAGFDPTTGLARLRAEIAELRREVHARAVEVETSGDWDATRATLLGIRADAIAHAISVLLRDPNNTIV